MCACCQIQLTPEMYLEAQDATESLICFYSMEFTLNKYLSMSTTAYLTKIPFQWDSIFEIYNFNLIR